MGAYSLSHLSDETLLHDLTALVARDRATTAELLAHISEVDARRLWVPAGHSSMQAYCVEELHLSEDCARKRIHAANVARRIPAVLPALADGRLHLSAVILLAPWLSPENASDLIGAATHKTRSEIEQLIADRYPRLDVPSTLEAIGEATPMTSSEQKCAPGRISVKSELETGGLPSKIEPLAPERHALQCTIPQSTRDKLRFIQELLSHKIPSGDLAEILDYMADATIRQETKRGSRVTRQRRGEKDSGGANPRYIPVDVNRAVRERDQHQCTFVSETGRRCSARSFLELDHIVPVARGGRATIANLRLRCHAHNRHEAERAFGTQFMNSKIDAANELSAKEARAKEARAKEARANEVIRWLRQLGFRANEARSAAKLCESIPDAPLEERVRLALSSLGPRASGRVAMASG
jgi:5-methylcytosine-specific restriction endonuclease McrA